MKQYISWVVLYSQSFSHVDFRNTTHINSDHNVENLFNHTNLNVRPAYTQEFGLELWRAPIWAVAHFRVYPFFGVSS